MTLKKPLKNLSIHLVVNKEINMKLEAVEKLDEFKVTIYGQYNDNANDYDYNWKVFSSEKELNDYIYLYIIYLDLYDKIENDSNYENFNYDETYGLQQCVNFYLKNQHKLQLSDDQIKKFFFELIDNVPHSANLGFNTISDKSDIKIRKGSTIYNIEYDENDVKEAIEKLVNALGGE